MEFEYAGTNYNYDKCLENLKNEILLQEILLLDYYREIFADYRKKGFIRRIPLDEINTDDSEIINYILHVFHYVYNPSKPGESKIVWDSAAKYDGSCDNDRVYSGNMNSLLGVLLQFWMGRETAIQAEINAMFNQVFAWYQGKIGTYCTSCGLLMISWWTALQSW